ncbi:hypothetical protein [Massilia pseudoviolaceinigra]|uniref:hypothetical protein n=1 Tax=Massilia pseudoviolaceinigra TaxID=3057165 RepID=UPI00279666B7|nr:hypothetical protein [Massilia sp. CCM 9206]MDQ1919398.1 hypothetical protein [Massilia sp. CCM 9206]
MNAPVAMTFPVPPYRYDGGNLGLGSNSDRKPWIYFVDRNGQQWLTHSAESVLRVIDQFHEAGYGGRDQFLCLAAIHYGMDAYALIEGRDFQPRAEA